MAACFACSNGPTDAFAFDQKCAKPPCSNSGTARLLPRNGVLRAGMEGQNSTTIPHVMSRRVESAVDSSFGLKLSSLRQAKFVILSLHLPFLFSSSGVSIW